MNKYLDAVGVLTLVVLIPICIGTLGAFALGKLTWLQYSQFWREPMLLLFGFWLHKSGADAAQKDKV